MGIVNILLACNKALAEKHTYFNIIFFHYTVLNHRTHLNCFGHPTEHREISLLGEIPLVGCGSKLSKYHKMSENLCITVKKNNTPTCFKHRFGQYKSNMTY